MTSVRVLGPDDDLTDLIALSREFFEEYSANHAEYFKLGTLRDEDITGFFKRSLASGNAATFVAVENGRTVGYITVAVRKRESFWRIPEEGHVSGLMVGKEHRRRGIATRLWHEAAAFFKSRGVRYLTVFTSVNNKGAIRFYERKGLAPLYCHMIGTYRSD